jgi:hypothetical protein
MAKRGLELRSPRVWWMSGLMAVAIAGCGDDHDTKLTQVDDPATGEHPFDPVDVDNPCEVAANCEDGDRCTDNRCIARECVSFELPTGECCAAESLLTEDFDGDLADGFEVVNLNEAAGWSVVEEPATSPPGSLYFGDPTARSYDKGIQVAGSVTLPAVLLPKDRESVLSMRMWAAIETSLEYDLFWIEADVMVEGLVSETVRVYSKRDLPFTVFQDFGLVDVPLTGLAGKEVRLRLRFDTLDGSSNAFEGIYIDDLAVQATCPIPPPCADDSECATEDPCVAAVCNAEVGCLTADICEEEEPNPCEAEGAPADCCIADSDCDDGDPRTLDVCDGATCAHNRNPDACLTAADCDDGEACTTDTCGADGVCGHTGTIGPGCCEPGEASIAHFDNESLQGIYVTDNFETGVFWRTDRTRSTSGELALYCGDPVTQTYAYDRRVKSSATTRLLKVPKGGRTAVEFDLFKATRKAKNWDVFQVFALRDGALFPLWSSRNLGDGTTNNGWQRVVVPLTEYAGSEVQVRFVFDTVDAPLGAFEGTYLDTLELVTTCN